MVQAYCVKCKAKVEMKDGKECKTANYKHYKRKFIFYFFYIYDRGDKPGNKC